MQKAPIFLLIIQQALSKLPGVGPTAQSHRAPRSLPSRLCSTWHSGRWLRPCLSFSPSLLPTPVLFFSLGLCLCHRAPARHRASLHWTSVLPRQRRRQIYFLPRPHHSEFLRGAGFTPAPRCGPCEWRWLLSGVTNALHLTPTPRLGMQTGPAPWRGAGCSRLPVFGTKAWEARSWRSGRPGTKGTTAVGPGLWRGYCQRLFPSYLAAVIHCPRCHGTLKICLKY